MWFLGLRFRVVGLALSSCVKSPSALKRACCLGCKLKCRIQGFGVQKCSAGFRNYLHSWKLTWKPKRAPIKTTVPLKWGYMGFHVSLGECIRGDYGVEARSVEPRVQGYRVKVLGILLDPYKTAAPPTMNCSTCRPAVCPNGMLQKYFHTRWHFETTDTFPFCCIRGPSHR